MTKINICKFCHIIAAFPGPEDLLTFLFFLDVPQL